MCDCPVVSLAERRLLGYSLWPSQLQGVAVSIPTSCPGWLSEPDLNCMVRVRLRLRVRVRVRVRVLRITLGLTTWDDPQTGPGSH